MPSTIAPPEGFVEEINPPDGFILEPPDGFVEESAGNVPPAVPVQRSVLDEPDVKAFLAGTAPPVTEAAILPPVGREFIQGTAAQVEADMTPELKKANAELQAKAERYGGFENVPMVDFPSVPQQQGVLKQTGAALANTAGGLVKFIESPKGISTAAAAALGGPVVARLIAGGFTLDMIKHVPEQVVGAFQGETWQQKLEAGLGAAMGLILGAKVGAHAAGPASFRGTPEAIMRQRVPSAPDEALQIAAADEGFRKSAPEVHKAVEAELQKRGLPREPVIDLPQTAQALRDTAEILPAPSAKVEAPAEPAPVEQPIAETKAPAEAAAAVEQPAGGMPVAPELTKPALPSKKPPLEERTFYHGTAKKIEGALQPGLGKNQKRFLHEEGIWFAPHEGRDFETSTVSEARRYSGDEGTVIAAKLTLKNPYRGDVDELIHRKINAKWLRDNGYDGFVDDFSGSGLVVVLDPKQITEVGRKALLPEQPVAVSAPEIAAKVEKPVDEATGLPLNEDGTVTVYHGTTKASSADIQKNGVVKSAAEPDVYFTTAKEGTGYGDGTVVAVRVDPKKLQLDDEFPDGRKDFRITVGAKKNLPVKLEPSAEKTAAPSLTPAQVRDQSARVEQIVSDVVNAGGDELRAENQASKMVRKANEDGSTINWNDVRTQAFSEGLTRAPQKSGVGKTESMEAPAGETRTVGETVAAKGLQPDEAAQVTDLHKAIEKLSPEHRALAEAFLSGDRRALPPQEVIDALEASMGPGAASILEQTRSKVGAYNAMVDEQRRARGLEPLMSRAREANPDTWDRAVERIEQDPEHPAQLVEEIHAKPERAVSRDEQAELLWRMTDLRNKLEMESERAADSRATPEEQAIAQDKAETIEAQLQRTEQADRMAGSAQGAALQFRQVLANEDYTFGGIMRRTRKALDRPLTAEERTQIKEQADQIAELQKQVEAGKASDTEAAQTAEATRLFEATINELGAQAAEAPRFGKEVLDAAERIVSHLEERASAASDRLRAKFGRASAGVDPTILADVAEIIAAKIGRTGLRGAKLAAELVNEYGPRIKPYLQKAQAEADKILARLGATPKVREAVKRGVKKELTVTDAAARAKAESLAGELVSRKTVYDLARAHLNTDMKGAKGQAGFDAVMKAVHADLKESYPDITERQVRDAYTDYGKVKLPSKEADKQALAEFRTIGQLTSQIEDLQAGLDAKKTGLQREKATQSIRDLTKQRNDLLQKRLGPPSPEKIASRDEAKQTALRNAIEDADRELRTGEKRERAAGQPDSPATERLRAELGAMREKLREIEAEEHPGMTPEERYNSARQKAIAKQVADIEERIRTGDYAKRPKKTPPPKTRETLQSEGKLLALRNKLAAWMHEKQRSEMPWYKKAPDLLQEVRGIVLGSDIGVLTRQGLFAWSRPVTAIRATAEGFKAAFSPEAMDRRAVEVRDREINGELAAPKRKAAGLQTTDTLTHPEELVVTRLLSRIPDIKVGGRAIKLSEVGRTLERFQTTFINAVRTDLFDSAIKQGLSPSELQLRANFINSATGRSNIRHVPKAMSAIFTSPRYEASRWEMLAQPFRNIGELARSGIKGKLDKAALANLQDMAVTAAGIYAIYKTAGLAGYSVNWNPTSTDFLKMRKGDEVWDVSAGIAPRLRDIMRIFVAFTNPTYQQTGGKVLGNMLLRTFNPALTIPLEQASIGIQKLRKVPKPVSWLTGFRSPEEQQGLISLAPLIVQATVQSLKDSPGQAAFTAGREFVGSSVNRYPDPEKPKPKSGGAKPAQKAK